MKTITEAISKLSSNRRLADFLFILWAGGAALLSYSLVYALRKPFTAATFDGIEAFGFDGNSVCFEVAGDDENILYILFPEEDNLE